MIETIKTDQNMNIDIEVKLDKHLISFKKVLLNQWLTRVLSLSGNSEITLPILKSIQQHWKPVTIFLLLVIAFLSLYPLPKLPEFPGTDKTHHLVAYFILALPSGLRKPKKWVLFILLFILFGGVIEMIQPYVNRYGEWLDFFANTIVFISFFAGSILNMKFLRC